MHVFRNHRHPLRPGTPRVRRSLAVASLVALLAAPLLAGCGDSLESLFDSDEAFYGRHLASGRPATLSVSGASDPRLNGTYASSDLRLTQVLWFLASGAAPQTCRFRFEGLQQAGSAGAMHGEIRYDRESNSVRTAIAFVGARQFRAERDALGRIDRAANAVMIEGAVLTAVDGSGQVLTLRGSVPMRNEPKAPGC